MPTVAIPIPRRDFDPTEVAISWKVLTAAGHDVVFATPSGDRADADPIMIDGVGLDPWGLVPGLRRIRILGLILRANRDGRKAHEDMVKSAEFKNPLRWDELRVEDYAGLVLPGGHRARGMREYLESPVLQKFTADFFASGKTVGAICHGVLLAARSRGPDGLSVLYGYKTTALTWRQERAASGMTRLARWWDADYYRTYKESGAQAEGFMSVQAEVTRALASPTDFIDVPADDSDLRRKSLGLYRDSIADSRPAWIVVDRQYVSARWPGDAHLFADTVAKKLSLHDAPSAAAAAVARRRLEHDHLS